MSRPCVHCGQEVEVGLLQDLPACGLGCALSAGQVPVGLVVRIDSAGGLWRIDEGVGTMGNVAVRLRLAPHDRVAHQYGGPRSVAPIAIREAVAWGAELELSAAELMAEHGIEVHDDGKARGQAAGNAGAAGGRAGRRGKGGAVAGRGRWLSERARR